MTLIITPYTIICLCQPLQLVQSRFLMHDLIKITKSKVSGKSVTFYFRIPQFSEYNCKFYEPLERDNLLLTYNKSPVIPY